MESEPPRAAASCRLCAGPLGPSQVGSGFCCEGCARVSEILDASGFQGDRRTSAAFLEAARSGLIPVDQRPNFAAAPALPPSKDARQVCLSVDGLWCPSCAWLVEAVLDRTPGVQSTRVTFFADIAEVSFDPMLIGEAAVAAKIEELGYRVKRTGEKPDHRPLVRFGLAAVLQMNVMWLSYALYAHKEGTALAAVTGILPWVLAALSAPVVFVAGAPMLVRAWRALLARALVTDSLIALASISAWLYSLAAAARGSEAVYFDAAGGLITFRLLGRLLEQSAFRSAGRAGEAVRRLLPRKARRITPQGFTWASADAIVVGERIRVAPGERVPLDGRVVAGEGRVSTAVVDGEPRPRLVRAGDSVPGGSICGETALDLAVTAPAAGSLLSRIADHVARASGRRGAAPEMVDAIARLFVPGVLVLSAVTLAAWFAHGLPFSAAFHRALSVLVVSCPCALGIAAPLARVVASGALAKRGIIVRGEGALDQVASAKAIAFDKTGTLTLGRPTLLSLEVEGATGAEALAALAGIEERAGHPIAEAARRALADGQEPAAAADIRSAPGRGVSGLLGGVCARAGRADWVQSEAGPAPAHLLSALAREQGQGRTAILLSLGSNRWAAVSFGDPIRPEAPLAFDELRELGLKTAVLSGDSQPVVDSVAAAVGASRAIGGQLPEDKARLLETAAAEDGSRALFVGDGINDAPGLAASVGIAVASGTDFARETADILLLEPGIAPVPSLVAAARQMRTIIRQNLAWAALYNVICIPLAAFGRLTPVWAAAAMVGSSLLVTLNALRAQRWKTALSGAKAGKRVAIRSAPAAA
jgi:Cu2+-exporting ATPase